MSSLDQVIITAELARRPSRPADYEGENRALVALMDRMAGNPPGDLLQRLAETAMRLCTAQSTRRGFGGSVTVRSVEHALDAEVDLAFADRMFETPGSVGVS